MLFTCIIRFAAVKSPQAKNLKREFTQKMAIIYSALYFVYPHDFLSYFNGTHKILFLKNLLATFVIYSIYIYVYTIWSTIYGTYAHIYNTYALYSY